MKTIVHFSRLLVLSVLAIAGFVGTARAQVVSIPDPDLDAAIRAVLQKPNGPLLQLDLLNLTNLTARARNISSLQGLEAAHNLSALDLESNHLTNVVFPNGLSNLNFLDLGVNPLTNLVLSADMTNLADLELFSAQLSNLTVPAALKNLIGINLSQNRLTSLTLPSTLSRLDFLDLSINLFTNLTLPAGLNALTDLELWANQLTSLTLPADMTNLIGLRVFLNRLTNLTVPPELKSLALLDLERNQFASFNLPANLISLTTLDLRGNQLTNVTLPAPMTNLHLLFLNNNQIASLTLPAGMTALTQLHLEGNQLGRFNLPAGMTSLAFLGLGGNQLTNLNLPADLGSLVQLGLENNQLTQLTLPAGLTNLATLVLQGNQLTNLTLPPDITSLTTLLLTGNPLTTFVLSEPLAATNLATVVATLQNQGIPVFTYPLVARLVQPAMFIGSFKFSITGPPGVYSVLGSTNLVEWSAVGVASNPLGSVIFHDATTNVLPQKFYRVLLQVPPANMVFIPSNTFTMGSPANELNRNANEGPQTTVTLTRAFWIGKYEVTQGEYLDVTGTNPSLFPGDPSRPVSSVSWPDATNYCWLLTQRELAAGRISTGSQYRLPTEAEWECAARAGTSTRFSYGDDPDYAGLPNYAWQSLSDGLTVHPVGQKLPNPWGLYDMYGNVLEWCQDWLGPLPGGSVTDPQGAPSNPVGDKIMRGGAFDFGNSFCRSASRLGFGNHPALNDWNLGFRVVLVTGP